MSTRQLIRILIVIAIAVLVFWLLRGMAHAQVSGYSQAFEVQALTRAAPTTATFNTTAAFNLQSLDGYRIMVCAESGQTLSGAGTLNMYFYDDRANIVARAAALDETIPASAAGNRCYNFPDREVIASRVGQIVAAATGVTVSGGTTITVYYRGFRRR